jgi:hypothetical protein
MDIDALPVGQLTTSEINRSLEDLPKRLLTLTPSATRRKVQERLDAVTKERNKRRENELKRTEIKNIEGVSRAYA